MITPADLDRLLAQDAATRLLLRVALDQLHEAQLTIERQREQIAALREELTERQGVPLELRRVS
jgi:hypothetical protein